MKARRIGLHGLPLLALGLLALAVRIPNHQIIPTFTDERNDIAQGADNASFYAGAISACCSSQIVDVIVQHRLATVHNNRVAWQTTGGLMFYGLNSTEHYRYAAVLADKILKGANRADLPFEQPSTYEFGISLKTARAIGLTSPQSVLH